MTTVDNSIVIDAPLELVWDMTNDVASWPELFSEYAKAEILATEGSTVRFRLTLHPDENGAVWDWVSERTPDPVTRTVRAHRVETGPFDYMNLYWEYVPSDAGVTMRWVQDFTVRAGLPFGDVEMSERLTTNTKREMALIKAKIERIAGRRDIGADGQPVQVMLTIELHPGKDAEFEDLWRAHAAAVAAEPGNLGQALNRRADAPGTYVVITSWTDEGAFRVFEKSPRQQEYLRTLWPLRARGAMTVLQPVAQVPELSPVSA